MSNKYTEMVERRRAGDFELQQQELVPFIESWMGQHGFSILDDELVEAFREPFVETDEGWMFDNVVATLEQIEREVRP